MLLYPSEIAQATATEEGTVQKEEADVGVQLGGGNVARAIYEGAAEGVLGRVYTLRLEDRVAVERNRVTGCRHEDSSRRVVNASDGSRRRGRRYRREGTDGGGVRGCDASAVEGSGHHRNGSLEPA